MEPGNIIEYMNACGKIKQAAVAKIYSETPHNIRIFNHPFDENSKSYVLGLGKRKNFKSTVNQAWDYRITNKTLKKEEENLLETLIKEMGPLSDRF